MCFCCIRVPSLRRRRSGRLHTADRLSGSITPKRVEPVDRLGVASEHGGHGVSVRQKADVWFTGGTPAFSASVPRARDPHSRRPIERRAVRVEWWPVHRCLAPVAPARSVPAAMPETGLMARRKTWLTPRLRPLGQCVGGWVIHFPAVVCTSSPSTSRSKKGTTDCPANCGGVQQETSTRRER